MHSFNIAPLLYVAKQAKTCFVVGYVRYEGLRKQRALEESSIKVRYDLGALLASFQKLLSISMTMWLIVTTDNCAFGKYVNYIVCIFSIFSSNNGIMFAFLQQMYKRSFLTTLWFSWEYFKFVSFRLFWGHVFVTKIIICPREKPLRHREYKHG